MKLAVNNGIRLTSSMVYFSREVKLAPLPCRFGGSANGGVIVGGSGPTPRSYSLGGSDWLICGYIGGVMTGCYVLPRQG